MNKLRSAATVIVAIAIAAYAAHARADAVAPKSVAVFSHSDGLSAHDAAYTRAMCGVLSRRVDSANGLNVVAEAGLPSIGGGVDEVKIWRKDSGEAGRALKVLRADVVLVVRVQSAGGGARADFKAVSVVRGRVVYDEFSASSGGGVAAMQKVFASAAMKKLTHGGEKVAGAVKYTGSAEAFRLFGEGLGRVEGGADKDAVKSFDAAAKADGQFLDLFFYLGKYYAVQKFDYEKSIGYLGRVTSVSASDAPARYWMGFTYYLKGNTALAIREFEASVKLKPLQPEALIYLAVLYKDSAQLDRMEAYYVKALGMAPDNPSAWYNLGAVQSMMSKTQEAVVSLGRALEQDCASFLPIVKNDADYVNARKKQEFVKLVKEYAGKCGK